MKIIKAKGVNNRTDDPFSFIGETIRFTGKIESKGTMSIDGHVKGDVSSIENLIVGKGAVIESDLDVTSLDLYGEVRGNISASDTITIHATGRVFGDIISSSVVMESGAVVDGRCTVRTEPATGVLISEPAPSVPLTAVGEGL